MCGLIFRKSGGTVSASPSKIKSIMTTLQLGRAYPLSEPRPLKTRPNKDGVQYPFDGTFIQAWPNKTIRVIGVDQDGVWCRKEYKPKKMPKWLKRGVKEVGKRVQSTL